MNMKPVSSSNLKSIGYDSANMVLYVQFLNGSTYKYLNVPKSRYDGLLNASSKGQYLHYYIKGAYTYRRVN